MERRIADWSVLRTTTAEVAGERLARLRTGAAAAAAVGLVLCAIGAVLAPPAFFPAYLFAYLFWAGAALGSLGLLLVHHMVGGGWGFILRRMLEAASLTLPLAAVLFLPLLAGLPALYPWARAHPEAVTLHGGKAIYLSPPFFIARSVFYFAVWIGLAVLLRRWTERQEERADGEMFPRLNYLGAWGAVALVLTVTLAAVDWVMSLTPDWYSSLFGLLVLVSQGLTALALLLVLLAYLAGDRPILTHVPGSFFRDLGNLLLVFIMLWAYMAFSQYLLIYSANLAEEVTWYTRRADGGWGWISLALIPLHFLLPFFVLLVGSGVKRDPRRLAKVAAFVLAMRLVDLFWWVKPAFSAVIAVNLADLGAPLLIGGIWLWTWGWLMRDRPVVPLYDPRLAGERAEGLAAEATGHG